MKKLTPPPYDDDTIATQLSANKRLKKAYPALKNDLEAVIDNYDDYINNNGNPWDVPEDGGLSNKLNEALKELYGSPPADLCILSEIRYNLSPTVCTMCGGLGNGTLDHYLPKNTYPQYSILTKNLVPCCNCNSLRQERVKGDNVGERALHPYYDDCLKERALSVIYSGDFYSPSVRIVNCYPVDAINYEAVKFHIDEIVKGTNIKKWMMTKWADLLRTPRSIIDTLPNVDLITEVGLRDCIKGKVEAKDQEFETPNNWESVFFHGLLNSPGAIAWLVAFLNAP